MPESRDTDQRINQFLGQDTFSASDRNRTAGLINTLLGGEAADAFSSSPTNTNFFRQGRAALNDQVDRLAAQDADAAAQRGLTGGTFEIAQLGQRNRALSGGLRDLMIGAEQQQQNRRNAVLSGLLNQSQLQTSAFNADREFSLSAGSLALQQQLRRDQRRANNQRFFSNLFQSGVQLFGGAARSGGGS